MIHLNNTNKVLNILGLARKAGKIVTGEDTVLKLLRQNKLKIVFVASDASFRQIDKFDKKCYFFKTQFNNMFSSEEISKSIGKPMCKVLGVTDQGFLDALNKSLNGGAINEG